MGDEVLEYSNWIWTSDWNAGDDIVPRLVYFRRELTLELVPKTAVLHISADTRYKFYVNGNLVQLGPSKGDRQVWFYDEIDVTPHLCPGRNVIAIAVLRYPVSGKAGNHSLFRTQTPGLYVKGVIGSDDVSANELWRCHVDRTVQFYAEEDGFAPLIIHEKAGIDPGTFGWRCKHFDGQSWSHAKPYDRWDISEAVSPAGLTPRTIPYMYRKARSFTGVFDLPSSKIARERWQSLAQGGGGITLAPDSKNVVVFDAGEEMNGYFHLRMSGGAGASIEILTAECYSIPIHSGSEKRNRLDRKNGRLEGYTDYYTVSGAGSEDVPELYEPYWYRTFRFVRLTIRTGAEPLTLHEFSYEETGYPLEVGTEVVTSDASLSDVWDISLRTLRRCMQETYMDCPYYEQLQYAMDTRAEVLYTYAVSADDRLARKALDDFRRAQRADGLLNCCYPNVNPNVIPGFSIYYILMVHDHMMYFGDKTLIRENLPVIDRILHFFDAHMTPEGLVGHVGGVIYQSPFWSFIDWAEPWLATSGMPPAGLKGPITIESLLYILGLQKAAELCDYAGRHDTASEYRCRAASVRNAIRTLCMDADGMIVDGPGSGDISQHGQVFAVLTDTISREEGHRNLLATLRSNEYARCTVAMCYYLFRALEKTDLYEYTDQYWDLWRGMIRDGCTTSVESDSNPRSECHAWGAVALYELPSVILGVRPAAPGYEKIWVSPGPGYLTSASGTVRTPVGDIRVSWELRDHKIHKEIRCSEAVRARLSF